MAAGVETVDGAVQVIFGPLPLNVPTSDDQLNFRSLTCDSASVTSTVTGTASDASAKFGGSFERVPCTVNVPMRGGVLFTGGPVSGGFGVVGMLPPHATARRRARVKMEYRTFIRRWRAAAAARPSREFPGSRTWVCPAIRERCAP